MTVIGAGSERPALLLLSGLLSDETVWAEVAARLADDAAVRIVCFPSLDSLASMAQHALRDAPARFAVAGHSMGGRVALELWRHHADRISGLALLNTGVHPCLEHEPASRGRLVQLGAERGMAAVAAEWLPPMLGASSATRQRVLPSLTAMVAGQTAASFAAQTTAMLNRPDPRPLLPSILVPTLLLSATGDGWSPLAQHADMQRLIPQATLVAVEDAGHMAPAEQPAAVAQALRSWLARLGGAAAPGAAAGDGGAARGGG
jgi:pimeloyl-ACP methyl ester carboxylesterase